MVLTTEAHFDVLILGGGFAGVYCAKELGKEARRAKDFRVGLVASENHMVFQPMLPEVAAASISPRHVINPIRQLCKGTDVFRGEVRRIDVENKRVHLNAGDFTPDVAIGFDQLVVALGATVDLSRVPGMSEHSLPMQRVGDAMKLRETIIGRFEEANLVRDRAVRRHLLSFVVVGGGYSGVETAGEILDLMFEMHAWYENVERNDFKVILVHSQDHVLPSLHRSLGDYAARKLSERGVEMVLNERVRSVTANHVTLNSGRVIDTHTVISTIGNAPHPVVVELADDLSLPTERGRLRVERTGRALPIEWLWSAGDCSAMEMENGEICPATAQFAQRQGTLIGENLLALRRRKEPRDFAFKGLGELAAIGHRTAVGEIMGFKFSGFLAWWIWRTVYVSKLPGLQRKLRVLLDWTFDLFFARDINLLSPQYTRLLKEIYLEKDDVLFHPNEPAFSLYFVKQGQVDVFDGERLVKSVFEGDYFGERALLEDGIWRFRAVAQRSTKLIALGAREFHALVQGSDSLKRMFVRSSQSYLSPAEIDELKAELIPETLEMPASDLMNRKVDALTPDTLIEDALLEIRENRHGSYPVVDTGGKLLGSIKRDDIYDWVKGHSPGERRRIGEMPLNHLPSAGQDTTGSQLVDLILRSGRNKIHIVDSDGRLCGLVTTADLLDHAKRIQKLLAEQDGAATGAL